MGRWGDDDLHRDVHRVSRFDDEDPDTARYECPHCSATITDAQRWRATRAGRFVTQLEPEDAKGKNRGQTPAPLD